MADALRRPLPLRGVARLDPRPRILRWSRHRAHASGQKSTRSAVHARRSSQKKGGAGKRECGEGHTSKRSSSGVTSAKRATSVLDKVGRYRAAELMRRPRAMVDAARLGVVGPVKPTAHARLGSNNERFAAAAGMEMLNIGSTAPKIAATRATSEALCGWRNLSVPP